MTYCPRCKKWSPGKKVLLKITDRTDRSGNPEYACPDCGYTVTKDRKLKREKK